MSELLSAALEYADRGLSISDQAQNEKADHGKLTPRSNNRQWSNHTVVDGLSNCKHWIELGSQRVDAIDVDAYKTDCAWDHYRGANIVDAGFIQKSPRGGLHYL